ncbi:hypothetical protein [Pseudoalteromonas sp. S16_S37]|uniref:hypothetical protein n=1 Tax=Pseudoalteromonas sp. S16_S37 TaxID=2720228 RepID=UPI00168034FA|nr:hypothetical protein [Pseudoalteromonas sp. S16_S37]MBD1582635.1 hypothetical protein [Pseudoalteromonas sp. S16_S37]
MRNSTVLVSALLFAATANAAVEASFGETQELLTNEDVKTLHIVDINADNRKDLVWVTNSGSVKYKLKNNDALASLETLPGTRWRLEYDNRSDVKFIDFTAEGGTVTTHDNKIYKISAITMNDLGKLDFCTPLYTGLNRTECAWHYNVTDILPNIIKGVDERLGDTWTAYKLVN